MRADEQINCSCSPYRALLAAMRMLLGCWHGQGHTVPGCCKRWAAQHTLLHILVVHRQIFQKAKAPVRDLPAWTAHPILCLKL